MASKTALAVNKKRYELEQAADPDQVSMDPSGGRPTGQESVEDNVIRAQGVTDEQFPTNALTSKSKYDKIAEAKLALGNQGQSEGVTPFGVAELKDKDIHWLLKKRETEAYANFQQWFATNFDKMAPHEKQYAREAFPQFYEERTKQLDRTIELEKKIAQLKILGIRSKEDMMLQWAIESGYIDASPLQNVLHPEKSDALKSRQARFKRGLLNPKRGRGDWGDNNRQANSEALVPWKQPNASSSYLAGVNGNPFSAYGLVTPTAEQSLNADDLYKGIFKSTTQAAAPNVPLTQEN